MWLIKEHEEVKGQIMIYVSKWIVIKFLLEVSTQLKYTDRDYTTKNSNPY